MPEISLPPDHVTPAQLLGMLQQIVGEQQKIRERIEQVEVDTGDLLAAWRAGGAVLSVVKWASAVGAGIAAIWAFVRHV